MYQDDSIVQSILFADIAGSTNLYEKVGDAEAQRRIADCLTFMEEICARYGGVIVKHIGDEILCRFDLAVQSVRAICEIQAESQHDERLCRHGLHIRAGINTGPAILTDKDVFGDTVNVAARMSGLASADQIICTEDTITAMGKNHGISYRKLDPLVIKGKQEKINIYEILWLPDDSERTEFFSAKSVMERSKVWTVLLDYDGNKFEINRDIPTIMIGRSNTCDFVVPSPHASRQHARMISRWGKIVLVDQSTNGTYVRNLKGDQFFVHREELVLAEDGEISLGVPGDQNPDDVIRFTYQQ